MPDLAAEGGDARNLARLASRLARANAAVEVLVDGAERYLALRDRGTSASGIDARTFDANTFAAMPEEIRLRLLLRAIDRFGDEGPAELGKVEALLSALDQAVAESAEGRRPRLQSRPQSRLAPSLKQTLAGALVSLTEGRISIAPAPPRRRRPD
jgi:tRNA(Ile)-lysidine synthase